MSNVQRHNRTLDICTFPLFPVPLFPDDRPKLQSVLGHAGIVEEYVRRLTFHGPRRQHTGQLMQLTFFVLIAPTASTVQPEITTIGCNGLSHEGIYDVR